MTTYKIKINGATEQAAYASEGQAIAAAKCYDCELNDVCVVMHEESGTYRSKTIVWPEVGTTYTD